MAKIVSLGVLWSVLLSFHVAVGDSGWIIPEKELDRVSHSSQDSISEDVCKILREQDLVPLAPGCSKSEIAACVVVSLKLQPNPLLGMYVTFCVEVRVTCGPLLKLVAQLIIQLDLRVGPLGFFVQACAVVDVKIIEENLLDIEVTATAALRIDVPAIHVLNILTKALCGKTTWWCKDRNYCFDFNSHPFPLPPNCSGIWKTHRPIVHDKEIQLNSRPVCTCRDMEEGVSVNLDSTLSFQITMAPTDQSHYFCHEQDLSYIFECIRKRGYFDDLSTSVSLTVAVLLKQIPTLVFSCPETAHIVLKIECTRIYVEMHSGHALLCIRLRVSIGCNALNFVSSLTFTVTGCLNLHLEVDCRRELLLLTVTLRSALRIRSTCTDVEGCENQDKLLTEIFLHKLTTWCLSLINAKISGGIRLPFLMYYPCDRCQRVTYVQHRVYCPCTLRYVHR